MNYTKYTLAAALCAAATLGTTALAETELPEISVGLDYSSKQVTRGLIDNEEGIVTASAAVEWNGFSAEVDGLFNTTDVAKEEGYDEWDNTEVDYIIGYGYTFGADDYGLPTDIEVAFDYTYEWDNGGDFEDNDHVQYLHASIGLPEVFLSPTLAGEWMLDQFHGQYYTLELSHGFDLIAGEGEEDDPVLALNLSLVQGLANDDYDEDDLGKDYWALRETTLTATLDWAVCDHITLSPYIAWTDTFSGTVRDAAKCEKHGDAGHFFAGLALSAAF